jgi:hypothetical protein
MYAIVEAPLVGIFGKQIHKLYINHNCIYPFSIKSRKIEKNTVTYLKTDEVVMIHYDKNYLMKVLIFE